MSKSTGYILGNNPGRGAKSSSARYDASFSNDKSRIGLAKDCGPVIYAARLKDGTIKIGYTADLYRRLNWLGCGLEGLLALMPGTLEQEQDIHSGLVAYRAHGHEYYHPHEQVLAVVNQMRATFDLKPIAA